MYRQQVYIITNFLMVIEGLIFIGGGYLAYFICLRMSDYLWDMDGALFAGTILFLMFFNNYLMGHFGFYSDRRPPSFFHTLRMIVMIVAFDYVALGTGIFLLKIEKFSRIFYGTYAGIVLLALIVERAILELYLERRQKTGFNCRQVLLVGSDKRSAAVYRALAKQRSWGHQVAGCLKVSDHEPHRIPELPVLGKLSDLEKILIEGRIDEVVFALPPGDPTDLGNYIQICEEMGVAIRIVPGMYDPSYPKIRVESIQQIPTLSLYTTNMSASGLFYKRVLDMIGGLVGTLGFMLLYPIVGLAIKLDSPGPVLFKQKRVGQNGRLFWLYKFRTMYVDAEARKRELMNRNEMRGLMFKIKNDPRITRVGRILRKTSIDEVPQFINVLRGEMSLVGTRPPTPDEVAGYEKWHRRRISMRPGITGLWQISGRNKITDFNEVVRLDLKYIDRWRFTRDLKILWKTIWVVMARKGAR